MVERQVPLESRFDEQARPWFAAGAVVALVVRADHDVIEGKGAAQNLVHPIQVAPGLVTAREAGLVGGGDEDESGRLQFGERFLRGGDHLEFFQRQRRDLLLGSYPDLIKDRIAFDDYCSLHSCEKANSWPNTSNPSKKFLSREKAEISAAGRLSTLRENPPILKQGVTA